MLTLSTQPDFEFSLVGGMSLGAPEVSGWSRMLGSCLSDGISCSSFHIESVIISNLFYLKEICSPPELNFILQPSLKFRELPLYIM